jgi:hypothetical protein
MKIKTKLSKLNMTSVGDKTVTSEDSDEERFTNLKRNIGKSVATIYPDSNFKNLWDWVSYILIFYESAVIPFFISFDFYDENVTLKTEVAIEIFFIMDISKPFE